MWLTRFVPVTEVLERLRAVTPPGLAPVSAPRLVCAVLIDEPSAGEHYGGVVAAPLFAQIMRDALRLLGVPLDAPPEPLELPGETDHAREST